MPVKRKASGSVNNAADRDAMLGELVGVVDAGVPVVRHRPIRSAPSKNPAPLKNAASSSDPMKDGAGPKAASLTRTVPASVPSVRHSSLGPDPLAATCR